MKKFILVVILTYSFLSLAQTSATPWLGIGIDKGVNGVIIEKVIPGTPAEKAKLKILDEITKVDFIKIINPNQLITEIRNKGIGNDVLLTFIRDGKIQTKKITLVARPDMLKVAKDALLNKNAPDFELSYAQALDKKFKLSDSKGKLVLIELWATWCPACISSMRKVHEFAKEYKGKIEVVAISNEEAKTIQKFIKKKLPKIINSNKSSIKYLKSEQGPKDVSSLYYSSSIPMFILVGKDGKVLSLDVGGGRVLDKLLKLAKDKM